MTLGTLIVIGVIILVIAGIAWSGATNRNDGSGGGFGGTPG